MLFFVGRICGNRFCKTRLNVSFYVKMACEPRDIVVNGLTIVTLQNIYLNPFHFMEFNNDFSSGFCSHEKYYSVPLVIDKSLRDRDYNTSWLILEIQSMACRCLHLHYLHPMVKSIFY